MPQNRDAFKLGVTVIVSLGLFVAALLFIGDWSFQRREPFAVRVRHTENVPRIKPGAAVICGPQQVGVVLSVSMVEAPALEEAGPNDFLYFEIRGEVNESLSLRADCTILVEGPLLGENGQLRILDRGTAADGVHPDVPIYARASGFANDWARITRELDESNPRSLLSRIKGQLDPMLSHSMMAKLHNSLDHINAMTLNLKASVDPDRKTALISKVASILENVEAITMRLQNELETGDETAAMAKVHRGLEHIDEAIKGLATILDENRPDIRSAVANARNVTATLDQSIVPAIAFELDHTQSDSLMAQTHAALNKLHAILADVSSVSSTMSRVTTLSEDRVLRIVDGVKEASDHLKAVAKDLRRNPWRLIHNPDDSETKQARILDAVREFSAASGHLDESAARLGALLKVHNGQIPETDPQLSEIRDRLTATMEQFEKAEAAMWKQLDLR